MYLNKNGDYMTENLLLTEEEKLYTNNTGKKSFQWELWQYCNSLCKFCYIGEENRVHNKERQYTSLKDLNLAIDSLDYETYNNISLIGGEFFQGQLNDKDVHDMFFDIIKKIFSKYLEKKIGSMWLTVTLTIGDQKHLYELLDLAEKMGVLPNEKYGASGLWLCTSWDSAGRFHSKKMEENWEYHMKNIKEKYPWIKFNTTIILQQDFIEKYINNKFKPKEFMKEFNTTLFFKQPGIPSKDSAIENLVKATCFDEKFQLSLLNEKKELNEDIFKMEFFPKRDTFLKFLFKFKKEDKEIYDRLFNIRYRSDELHRNFNYFEHDISLLRDKDSMAEEVDTVTLPCGHIYHYAPYIDSNRCCVCDKRFVENE
jgi:hypothetical protein